MAMANKGYTPLFLPAYSPQFQPIELVFGRLKLAYYRLRLNQNTLQLPSILHIVEHLVDKLCENDFIQHCFRHVNGIVHDTY
jgi:transposase